jgi:hypothetical protein
LIDSTWDVLLYLLETGTHATAGNTAQLVGELIARWWLSLRSRLSEALGAIARRRPDPNAPSNFRQGDWALLSGWLLHPCLKQMEETPDSNVLISLHPYVTILGYRTYATVLQLHTTTEIPLEIQWSLLESAAERACPES